MKLGSMGGVVAVAGCRAWPNPAVRAVVASAGTPPGQVSRSPAARALATAPIRQDRRRAYEGSGKLVVEVQAERVARRIEEHADVFLRLKLGEARAQAGGVGHRSGQIMSPPTRYRWDTGASTASDRALGPGTASQTSRLGVAGAC